MLKRFFHSEKGSTAVEFAIVGVPFVFALIGLCELSLMYTANSLLQESTTSAARMIRTGQVQQSGGGEEMFQDELCRSARVFLNCANIQYEVLPMDNGFGDVANSAPAFDENGNLQGGGFNPPGSDQVVLIRTVYYYPLMTPLIGTLMSDGPNQTKFMMSTVVLQTEPYEFNAGG